MAEGRDSGGDRFRVRDGTLLAAAVHAVALVPALFLGVSGPVGEIVLTAGAVVGSVAGSWRLARALHRFDAHRRRGL
ncbi:DUF6332 family protein [Streptomyces sp. NRRL S-350]|uniref:DUF6332 family protein n=1 Tax=Streptomyces sp. NRRL S-350 TaxID=1463902 RepID=UPI002D21A0AC|nr:DUF6332 family protein [Streptomyces sp. NRRL S-350]